MIRILIVEDHAMVRDAIASLLGEVPDMEVVATACNIREALRCSTNIDHRSSWLIWRSTTAAAPSWSVRWGEVGAGDASSS